MIFHGFIFTPRISRVIISTHFWLLLLVTTSSSKCKAAETDDEICLFYGDFDLFIRATLRSASELNWNMIYTQTGLLRGLHNEF